MQISMPRVGFKPTIQVFERAKMVHTLDRATTVIGAKSVWVYINIKFLNKHSIHVAYTHYEERT
jgi:hypothetical protein